MARLLSSAYVTTVASPEDLHALHESMLIVAVGGGGGYHGWGGSGAGAGGTVARSEQVGTNGIYTVVVGGAGGTSSVTKAGLVTVTAVGSGTSTYNATTETHGNARFLKHLSGYARSATYSTHASGGGSPSGHGSGGPGAGGSQTGSQHTVSNGGNGVLISEFVTPGGAIGSWPSRTDAYFGGGGGSGNHAAGGYTGTGTGTHGGGNGATGCGASGTSGAANTGGGAGGDGGSAGSCGGGGGSVGGTGVVIVRIPAGVFTLAVTGSSNSIVEDSSSYDYIFMKETGTFTLT